MPAAPVAGASKAARHNSIYGWRKRSQSVSPNPTAGPSAGPHVPQAPPPRIIRAVEPTYYEEQYQSEIIEYMMKMDELTLASADLMDMQPELQWFMRPYLIDFLIEVHTQFRLRPEVLYLTMNIVDRYVSKRVVYKKHYQLVGCAALWIAAKFEDGKDKVPLVRELAEMCCKAYDESAFIQMEGHVLSTIGWTIGAPTAEAWLRVQANSIFSEDIKIQHMARFVMEITLFHREFIGLHAELIAAGALMLARYICGRPQRSIKRIESVAVRVAYAIDRHFAEKMDTVSDIVCRKYAPTYYHRVSVVAREWYLSGRRYAFHPEVPVTPTGLPACGLAPSGSWLSSGGGGGKRESWVSGSPGTMSTSCSSSEAGDEVPTTPITPVHANVVNPFDASAKENVAPSSAQVFRAPLPKDLKGVTPVHPHPHAHAVPVGVTQPRPPLHAITPCGVASFYASRRLSN